jgi:hypothetical protein
VREVENLRHVKETLENSREARTRTEKYRVLAELQEFILQKKIDLILAN